MSRPLRILAAAAAAGALAVAALHLTGLEGSKSAGRAELAPEPSIDDRRPAPPSFEVEAPPEDERAAADGVPAGVPAGRSHAGASASSGPAASSPVRGRVVVAATGEPLAGVRIGLRTGSRSEETRADPRGRFESRAAFRHGWVRALVLDGAGTRPTQLAFEHDGEGEEVLRMRTGPRFALRLVGPADAEERDWEARILRAPDSPDRVAWPWSKLERDPPWILQYQRFYRDAFHPGRTVLEVRDEDGLWRGEVEIPGHLPARGSSCEVHLTGLAALTAVVRDSRGQPVPDAEVVLEGLDDSARNASGERSLAEAPDARGRFRFGRLAPGAWRLSIAAPDRPVLEEELELPVGETDLGERIVAHREVAGPVSGIVRSASGTEGLGVMLELRSLDGQGIERRLIPSMPALWVDRDFLLDRVTSKTEVAFEMRAVPVGRYELVVHPLDGFEYRPRSVQLSPPAEDVVIERRDGTPTYALGFRVLDARTGAEIDTFEASLCAGGWRAPASSSWRSGQVIGRVPETARLRWTVSVPGYRPRSGDESAFPPGGERRVAEVELERGWGALLLVLEAHEVSDGGPSDAAEAMLRASRARPLAGAAVLLDGEPAGTSDARGRVLVTADSAPERIDVALEGFRLTASSPLAGGEPPEGSATSVAWMVRAD